MTICDHASVSSEGSARPPKRRTFAFWQADEEALLSISKRLGLNRAAALRIALQDVDLRLRGHQGILAPGKAS